MNDAISTGTGDAVALIRLLGAGGFGAVIGWYLYYTNRHRTGEVKLADLVTVVGVLGGGAIMALFPAGSTLFGAYGIGLFLGFFGYFVSLLIMVAVSRSFSVDWMLDGRRARLADDEELPGHERAGGRAMLRATARVDKTVVLEQPPRESADSSDGRAAGAD